MCRSSLSHGSRIHTHVFVFKFSWSKLLFPALVYIYMTLSFTNIYIMFKIMYTPSSMILSFLYFKTFLQNFPKVWHLLFSCFRQDRPTGPVDRRLYQDVHACARLSADRRVDRLNAVCSRVFWVDRPQNTLFLFRGRSTERSTRVQRLLASRAGGRPDRSTARPAKLQRLFPLWCLSLIHI